MKRQLYLHLLVIILLGTCSQTGLAQEELGLETFQHSIQAQLEALDLAELLDFAQGLEEEYRDFLPNLTWRELVAGGGTARPGEVLATLARTLFKEIYVSLDLLKQLVVVGILAALLQRLSTSFGSKTVVDLAFAVCFLILVLLGVQSFQVVVRSAQEAVGSMVDFMYALLPMLSTLLTAVGAITTAAIFHPLLWALVGTIATVVQRLLLPLILLSTAFSLVAQFSSEFSFPKVGKLLRQGVITILGIIFIVFSGFMVVRGAIAPISDGISLRAAKYLTKTLIPIAGGMFADALEAVVGGSLLIKNAVGVFGLLMILFLVAAPLLKVWAMVLIYKAAGLLLEPLSDPRLVRAVGALEDSLTLVAIALGTVAIMFFLAIVILVGMGNLAVFLR